MKNIVLLIALCMSISAFASQVSNETGYYYHVCTTSDAGKSWNDAGTVDPSTSMDFDASADAVAIGKIGDCSYSGNSWNNLAADVQILNWYNNADPTELNINDNAAMIFWQTPTSFTHISTQHGLDSVCMSADDTVSTDDGSSCWIGKSHERQQYSK